MQLTEIEPRVVKESVEPAIVLGLTMRYNRLSEALIDLEGSLFSADKKLLSTLAWMRTESPDAFEIWASGAQETYEANIVTSMTGVLTRGSLDHIEGMRDKNPKKAVNLSVEINATVMQSTARLSSLHVVKQQKVTEVFRSLPIAEYQDHMLVTYKYEEHPSTRPADMWVLSGEGRPQFLNIVRTRFEKDIIVHSDDWVHDFSPNLGMGRYMVVELPIIEPPEIDGELGQRIGQAIESLNRMESDLTEGNWTELIEHSRPVFELLRKRDVIKEIVVKDGYTEAAANDLLEGIQSLWNLSSKFHHRVDRETKKITQEIKASKEDAYQIYATATCLVNLLARKIKRHEDET